MKQKNGGAMAFFTGLCACFSLARASGDVALDTGVCVPRALPTEAAPPPVLGDIWRTEIEWKDRKHSRSYYTKVYADVPNKREAVVVSVPYHKDVKLFFDFFTNDVLVDEAGNDGPCYISHGVPGVIYSYRDQFWLTSFSLLFGQFVDSRDAVQVGMATIRGIRASNWSACLFDFTRNLTLRANMYFSDVRWMSPFQQPNSMAPLRVEYWGRQTNGSVVTEYSVQGDLPFFDKSPVTPPQVFVTDPGDFCPNRTGESMRFPVFPDRFSLLMEKVDVDFKRIVYEELWYDRTLKMVRWDNKLAVGRDDDPLSYIFDFNTGVKYIIDRHLLQCEPLTPLVRGDDFTHVYSNGTLDQMSPSTYFHSETAEIQYVGQTTVRDVLCDTWVGQYFDVDANRIVTVQWFFTVREWMEATGSVEGGGAFFRMEVWNGGSSNPTIYNVMRYNPSPPDISVFDFGVCYGFKQKKHFTAEFRVLNPSKFSQLSGPYLKQQVMTQLSSRLQIQPNRFTDVSFDFSGDSGNGSGVLYMTATLLERATRDGKPLQGVFDFLVGSIAASHFQIFLADPEQEPVPLEGVNVVEHVYAREFTTTSTLPPTTTIFVVPTRAPPTHHVDTGTPPVPPVPGQTTPTTSTGTCPPPLPCACPTLPSPASTSSPSSAPTTTTTPLTCPPTPCNCPSPTPCPPTTAKCPSTAPATTCPPVTPCPSQGTRCTCPSQAPSTRQQRAAPGDSSATGVSVGALVGGLIGTLLLGIIVGFVVTRFYHVLRVERNPMTINLIDNEKY